MPVAMIGPKLFVTDSNGAPVEGAKIYTYEIDGVTEKDSFDGENGSVNANPVLTNAAGLADVYLDGVYEIVVKDADDNLLYSKNPVTSANQLTDVWIQKRSATYASTTTFTVSGNQTSIYTVGRRVKLEDSATLYGTISASSYSSPNTTVTVTIDGGTALSGSLSYAWVHFQELGNYIILSKGPDVASATSLDLADNYNYYDVTGTTTIAGIDTRGVGGYVILHFDSTPTLTHHATDFILLGGADITAEAGDQAIFFEYDAGKFRMVDYARKSGLPVVSPSVPTGGTTATGDVTLTSASPAVLKVTPSGYGFYATFPDATTLDKGPGLYVIHNAGVYPYGAKDGAGNKLGWVPPGESCIFGLADKSATAGDWVYSNLSIFGQTALYSNFTATTLAELFTVLDLDSDRSAILYRGSTCSIQIFNHSTRTFGAPVTVRASVNANKCQFIKTATDRILVTTCNTTDFEAVIVSVSGTTPTVESGTKDTATLGASMVNSDRMVECNSAFILPYNHSTQGKVLAITVSDVTPTIGAETDIGQPAASNPVLFVTGTDLRSISVAGTTLESQSAAVSGTTITPGTADTVTVSVADFRAFQNAGGNIVIQYINTTHRVGISSLSGTTETISEAVVGSTISPANSADIAFIPISATKTLAATCDASGGDVELNIITDTSGTASAGTAIDETLATAAISSLALLKVTGTDAHLSLDAGTSGWTQVKIDCSGSSPAFSSRAFNGDNSSMTVPGGSRDKYNINQQFVIDTPSGVLAWPITTNPTQLVEFTTEGAIYHRNTGFLYAVADPDTDTTVNGPGGNSTFMATIFGSEGMQLALYEVAEA